MPKYRNTRTGRVVNVPDTAPTRQNRPMRANQWAQNLARLGESDRWERVADNTKVGMPKTPPARRKKARTVDDALPEPTGTTGDGSTGGDEGSEKKES